MARRRFGRRRARPTRTRAPVRRRYSQRKNFELKKYAKKAGYGALAGMALAVPVSLAAKYLGKPELLEVADRGGSVTAAFGGGPMGVAAYQVADAIFDRLVIFGSPQIGGGRGGYL